jgi:nitrate/nitrite-specific signal transduction histidine kinase
MRERAAAIGAILEVASHAGGGAQVTLRWTGTTARQRARPTSGETAG